MKKLKEKYKLLLVYLLKRTDYKPSLIIEYPEIVLEKDLTQKRSEHLDSYRYRIYSKHPHPNGSTGQYICDGYWMIQGRAWKDSIEKLVRGVKVKVEL